MNAPVGFSDSILRIPISMQRNRKWEKWLLVSADRHFDNPASDRKLQVKHLEQARERDASVIDVGDLFCAMQGKYDPRHQKSDVLPRHQCDDYLDSLVEDGTEFFGPYADLFSAMCPGNHCLSILKRCEINLLKRLVNNLNAKGGNIHLGGYRGWIRLVFSHKHFKQTVNIYYSHGTNSNAPVTKGILQTGRRAVWLPDADIVLSGHIHESWVFPIYRTRISQHDIEYVDRQLHVQIPTYKEEFLGKQSNFHHINGRPPKPLGAWWVRFWFDDKANRIKFQALEAD